MSGKGVQGQTALLVSNETQKCGFLRPSPVRGWLLVLLIVRMGEAGVRGFVTHLKRGTRGRGGSEKGRSPKG